MARPRLLEREFGDPLDWAHQRGEEHMYIGLGTLILIIILILLLT